MAIRAGAQDLPPPDALTARHPAPVRGLDAEDYRLTHSLTPKSSAMILGISVLSNMPARREANGPKA